MVVIGEFGFKIKNFEASTVFEYNNGVRDHYEYKDAMFTNSLFCDFLLSNGMKTWKDESTRDIICLEFNYGSRSYLEDIDHLRKIANKARIEYDYAKVKKDKYLTEIAYNKREKITGLVKTAYENKHKYIKMSKQDIRKYYYNNGIDIPYITYDKDGNEKKREVIHYKMLYRSTGKAKKGSCMFIRDKLFKKARDFLYMGIKLPEQNAKIVEISAYAPLISSAIVGRVKINPKNILVLKDVDRFFTTNVVSIETDENKHCFAKDIENYKLKNTLFDGQALIDSSIFPEWGNGYILLRHHFCKMAAFNTNIQKFFKDYFGDDYYSATVEDMFGKIHYVRDIELITTDNAMKWLKFNKSYDYWCEKVYENGCMFGIVKTAHESKLGNTQKMSYQMVNSLDESIMANVVKTSVDYVELLKRDDDAFLEYLKKNQNFSNDYEVLVALCEQNHDFVRSEYFRDRKRVILDLYVYNLKNGKITQNAENLTVIGSPYAMLLYATCGNPEIVDSDDTFSIEDGTIQCYTERFEDGEHLAFFRSPFNGKYNLTYLHNVYSEKLKNYFNFGKQIIAINMNGTDAQDRNNGMDMDSDFGYTTNQLDIVEHARKCYRDYHTIVNNIPMDSNVYSNSLDDYAKIDNALAASQTDIGESSNLAQIAQTYACNFDDDKYKKYVCILSVLAQVAIDNAKRRFDIDLTGEIKAIKNDMNIKEYKYPKFWGVIKHGFNKKNINNGLICPMNYLSDIKISQSYIGLSSVLPMKYFFKKYSLEKDKKTCKKVEDLISKYTLGLNEENIKVDDDYTDYYLLRSDFNALIDEIRSVYISSNYLGLFSWLIDRAFFITPRVKVNSYSMKSILNKNRSILMKVLYEINSKNLLKCFQN